MLCIHALPPTVGQIFVAIASDKSGAGIYKCVAPGQYLQFGEESPTSDEDIMLEGSSWSPISSHLLDEAFMAKETP
jgi:hypothetical protein